MQAFDAGDDSSRAKSVTRKFAAQIPARIAARIPAQLAAPIAARFAPHLTILLGAAAIVTTSTTVLATVTQYATRAAFNAAFPGTPVEDFEEARVAVGTFGQMAGPLDKFTNNAIFLPNEIIDGLRVNVVPTTAFPLNTFIPASGFANYTSHAVSYNDSLTGVPQMSIDLYNGDVSAIGLDLTSNPNGHTITVTAFSQSTNLGSFTVPNAVGTGTFFGISNDSGPITHLDFSTTTNFFGLDNVAMGGVPEPASAMAVSIVGLGALLRRRRWRR